MNYIDIDNLKNIFSNIQRNQNTVRCMEYGLNGKLLAIGYNPFWTTRQDSKIVKLELEFIGENGVIVPLVLNDIVDYELYPKENKKSKKYRINMIELIMFSPNLKNPSEKRTENDIYEKAKLEIIYDD